MDADVIVVGGGLAGLVATAELAGAGRRVILLEEEPEGFAGRPGVLVARRAVHGRHSRAAAAAHQGLARTGLAGLARHRGLRPAGAILAPDGGARGVASNRDAIDTFELRAGAVLVTSGGIDGNRSSCGATGPSGSASRPRG
jgi:predicted oxidoreductase